MGPTASGKTALAEALADELNAQLINADAFQVYRGLDIGTGKSTSPSRYDLLSIKDSAEAFGVGEFIQLASKRLTELFEEGRDAIVVGGTGFYIRALFEGYQDLAPLPDPALRDHLSRMPLEEAQAKLLELAPESIQSLDLKNPIRVKRQLEKLLSPSKPIQWCIPPYIMKKLAIVPSVEETDLKVQQRVVNMMQNGWIGEVEALKRAGHSPDEPGLRAIGYRSVWAYLNGEQSMEDTLARTITDTRIYAKKQRTWLRSEPKLVVLDSNRPLADARERCGGMGN